MRYLDHPDVAELGYLAYSLHLTWGTTPAANDQAVLQILEAHLGPIRQEGVRFEEGRVTALEQFKLNGPLPPELGQLARLSRLFVYENQLTGPLPPELGQLQHLAELDLGGNQLTTLPPAIGQLPQLQALTIDHNQLTSLPPELGQLAQLQSLGLSGNQLTTLPPELGPVPKLFYVTLRHNQLTGCLPQAWQARGVNIKSSGNERGPHDLPFCEE